MPGNKAVAYIEPGKVEVQNIDYPAHGSWAGHGGEARAKTARLERRCGDLRARLAEHE